MAKTDIAFEEHPLFPIEAGEHASQIAWLQLCRYENGQQIHYPKLFRADEIQSLEAIYELFGGGTYEIIARGSSVNDPAKPGRISDRRRVQIPGMTRPFYDNPNEPAKPPLGTAPLAGSGAADSVKGPEESSTMAMFLQMQMQMMQMSQQAAQSQATMIAQMMASSKAESSQMMQMVAQMNAQSQQSMVGMITAVLSTTAQKGGGIDDIGKVVELMGRLKIGPADADGGEKSENIGQIVADVADIVQGVAQMKSLPGVPPNPGPGSAASLLQQQPS